MSDSLQMAHSVKSGCQHGVGESAFGVGRTSRRSRARMLEAENRIVITLKSCA